MRELSEQEVFWRGAFGDQYVSRNQGQSLVAANLGLFAMALARTTGIDSLLELGTNSGNNLLALRQLMPSCALYGVEINAKAHAEAQALDIGDIWLGSLFDYPRSKTFDLTLSK